MSPLDLTATTLLMIPLAWTVSSDSGSFRIPNAIPLLVIGLYAAHALAAWPMIDVPGDLLVGGICLVVGFVIYAFGWFGAGDTKLFAALGLWAGTTHIAALVMVTALTGAGMALIVIADQVARSRLATISGGWVVPCSTPLRHRRLPYGIAIAAGGVHLTLQLIGG